MLKNKLKLAFTLIELLVVIAIIGILSALIIVGMNSTTQKATIAKAQVFASSLRNSLMGNLVSEWKLEGNANDSWSGGNNGNWYGAGGGTNLVANYRPVAECISGQCLNFDGTDDYIESFSEVNVGTGPVTLSIWAKSSASIIEDEIGVISFYYNGKPWFFTLEQSTWPGSHITVYVGYPDQTPSAISGGSWPIGDTNWHNLVVTRGSLDMSLYFDGTRVAYSNHANFVNFDIGNKKIRIGFPSEKYFTGLIDEARIFNAAMSTSQIQQNYFAGLNKILSKNEITNDEYNSRIANLVNNYAKQ